jgi:hypothetical protein
MYNGLSEVNRDTFIPLHRGITGGNATLEAGDVAVCYVPLFRCMLQEPNYVYPAGFQNHLIVRVYVRGGCTLGASDIDVSAVNLLVQSYHYDASIRQQILSRCFGELVRYLQKWMPMLFLELLLELDA